ncbi:NUDIX domain-containing protein [Candidatus Woesebacteria bacterium]|nr:NUDIX domain-containing protein [Candidatus Woesebacteria bacterium]MCD8507682.1 NUDIX domain-containing protein [Candidatus Woesebacteria bacterium]MCD8546522.1 NUDIX domain-containing protein [Candidatus Woesebacteria bacterium]
MDTDSLSRMQQENELLIAVNSDNEPLFPVEKIAAHQKPGQLHRAITLFLFSPTGKILVTQRSAQKPLWPKWWDAAASTHQWWPDEDAVACAQRRLPFELGIDVSLVANWQERFHYEYHVTYDETWSENEINFIVTAQIPNEEALESVEAQLKNRNTDEVAAYEWLAAEDIARELKYDQHRFAPWFPLAFEKIPLRV